MPPEPPSSSINRSRSSRFHCSTFLRVFRWTLCAALFPAWATTTNLPSTVLDVPLIERLTEEFHTNHPAIKAALHRTSAANLDVDAVRYWGDPQLRMGGILNSRRGGNPAQEGNVLYGVEQRIPVFGKERAARGVAKADAALESERTALLLQFMRRDLSKALFELALTDRLLALGREDLAWLDTQLRLAESRLLSATGSQLETLRLQGERARRTAQLATEHSRRDEARVTVNRLLNRDSSTPFPTLELPEIADAITLTPDLLRHATNTEPRLLVATREIRSAEARVHATRKSRLPNLAVGIEGRQFHGDAGFREGMLTVGFNLPWFNATRYGKDLERDKQRHASTRLERESLLQEVVAEIHHRIAAIAAARREALVYRDDLIPRNEQAVQLAVAGWMSSRIDARDMMEARRMQVDARVTLARACATQWIEMSDLVLCCGLSDLELLQELGRPASAPTPNP